MPFWSRIFSPQPTHDPSSFGFAVAGLGHGAEKFLAAVASSTQIRVTALVSRDPRKAEKLARKYGIPTTCTYANFDTLRHNPHVQAVYIAIPNLLHRSFTERAAAAGKHVLCEKPLASNIADAQAMIDACSQAGVLLMTAYRCSFDPMHERAAQILASGRLGQINSITSDFGFRAKPGWRLDPTLAGGGSLHDVGIYAVHTLHDLFPGAFTIQSAQIKRDPTTGLELETTWQATLPNGAQATCRSSYLTKLPDSFRIEGSTGTLTLEPAYSYADTRLVATYANQKQEILTAPRTPSPFRLEAEHLAHCALTGAPLRTPGQAGQRDLETIAAIEHAARIL